MQKIIFRKRFCALLAALAILASVSFGQITVSAETQQGALGTQQPAIVAAYTDADGNTYDGNALAPGSYTMTLSVSDLYSVADVQLTASFDEEVLSFSLLGETLLSDTLPHMYGQVMSRTGGEFSFFLFSTNSDMTVLPDNGAVLLSIGITVKGDTPVDMQNILDVNESPDFTYISVNYGDSDGTIHNCYALSDPETFSGTVYTMTCDLSPDTTQYFTVSAYVGALASPGDEHGTYATTGAVVTVTTDNSEISATTDENGKFVLENVPEGTYTATITYKYGFDRTFKIIVDGADIKSDIYIGIIGCNWDGGTDITGGDIASCASMLGIVSSADNFDVGFDIDRSGDITGGDLAVGSSFIGTTSMAYQYADTVLTT